MGVRSTAIGFLLRTVHDAHGFELGVFDRLRLPQESRGPESVRVRASRHRVRITRPETGHERSDRDLGDLGGQPAFWKDDAFRTRRERGCTGSQEHTPRTPGARAKDCRGPCAACWTWWVHSRLDLYGCRCVRRIHSRRGSDVESNARRRIPDNAEPGAKGATAILRITDAGGRDVLRAHSSSPW